jgi:hypothetical protein
MKAHFWICTRSLYVRLVIQTTARMLVAELFEQQAVVRAASSRATTQTLPVRTLTFRTTATGRCRRRCGWGGCWGGAMVLGQHMLSALECDTAIGGVAR